MKPTSVIITKVTPEDTQTLLNIGRQTFYNSFGPPVNTEENINIYLNKKFTLAEITKELHTPESQFYFAIHNDTIAGYSKLNHGSAQSENIAGNVLEIERIYVVKEFQRKKIGQHLFTKAQEIAATKKVDFIWLGVWDQNIQAINFYKRNGFIPFDQHEFMLGTELQTDIMMKCFL